jgi:hypothetical protein
MQEESGKLDRRSFLRVSGAGTVVAGTASLFPSLLFASEEPIHLTDRPAPVNPVRLHSSEMELILDRNDGVPFAFRLLADGATLRGEDFGRKIPATVCQKAPWKSLSLESSPTDLTTTSDAVEFHFVTNSGNTRAASFTLRYELLRTTLRSKTSRSFLGMNLSAWNSHVW